MSDYVALLVRGANRLSEASIEKEKIELAEQRGRRGSSFGLSGTTGLSSRSSSSSSSSKQSRNKIDRERRVSSRKSSRKGSRGGSSRGEGIQNSTVSVGLPPIMQDAKEKEGNINEEAEQKDPQTRKSKSFLWFLPRIFRRNSLDKEDDRESSDDDTALDEVSRPPDDDDESKAFRWIEENRNAFPELLPEHAMERSDVRLSLLSEHKSL